LIRSCTSNIDVKRGLRDLSGKGVLAGLTEVSDIIAYKKDEHGAEHPCDGELYIPRIRHPRPCCRVHFREPVSGLRRLYICLLFSRLPTKGRAGGFFGAAGGLPHASDQFCARHNTQSTQPRHDEHAGAQRADACTPTTRTPTTPRCQTCCASAYSLSRPSR
jgi:hypothetical protein